MVRVNAFEFLIGCCLCVQQVEEANRLRKAYFVVVEMLKEQLNIFDNKGTGLSRSEQKQ